MSQESRQGPSSAIKRPLMENWVQESLAEAGGSRTALGEKEKNEDRG